MADWQEAGLAPVVVAREQEPGESCLGSTWSICICLGIKDVFTRTDYSLSHFERDLPRLCAGEPEKCSVELAHEVIYGAMEYAEKIGFSPHPDFKRQMADLMLDPPDAHPRVDHVVLSAKMANHSMSPDRTMTSHKISFVISTLKRTCGEGNFNILVGLR